MSMTADSSIIWNSQSQNENGMVRAKLHWDGWGQPLFEIAGGC